MAVQLEARGRAGACTRTRTKAPDSAREEQAAAARRQTGAEAANRLELEATGALAAQPKLAAFFLFSFFTSTLPGIG
jgi:hypothetical protein